MLFDPINHTYSEEGVVYESVSRFLDRFKPKFPAGLLAEKTAQRDGRTAEDVLAEWELCGEISAGYGTAIHKSVEYWIRWNKFPKVPHLKIAVEVFAKKHDRTELHAETIVKSKEHKLAGTTDIIRRIAPKRVKILDIKTNGEITDKAKGKFLAPLQDLPFSKLNEFRLQLSTYKALLERQGVTVESLELEHWNGADEFKTIELEPIDVTPLLATLLPNTNN